MPVVSVGPAGRPPWPTKIVLVATHADKANCAKNTKAEFFSPDASMLLNTVREKYQNDFDISDQIFVVDAHLAMSGEFKSLRTHLGDLKEHLIKVSRLVTHNLGRNMILRNWDVYKNEPQPQLAGPHYPLMGPHHSHAHHAHLCLQIFSSR